MLLTSELSKFKLHELIREKSEHSFLSGGKAPRRTDF